MGRVTLLVVGLACGIAAGLVFAVADAATPDPILITGMTHLDPLVLAPDSNVVIASYVQHRQAVRWYRDFADSNGLRLSAQMTGVYAEACVRKGNTGDFAEFMPAGPHHLGTHMHPTVKTAAAYQWRLQPTSATSNPDSVRRVVADNLSWINRVFEGNSRTAADNTFFHGIQGTYAGMDTMLWCPPTPVPVPYTNCFDMAWGTRGDHWLHRGGFLTEPWASADTSYLRLPEVGGLIGFDQLHGPEGMVYGTLPYQQRDFLRVYIEWREDARLGTSSAERLFNWGIHPYQMVPGVFGTDGRTAQAHIRDLVAWLNANFIGRADETGCVMARYANAGEMRDAHAAWRAAHPAEAATLQATIASGTRPLRLPALWNRLDSCYWTARVSAADTALVIHQFTDRSTGRSVWLAWSRSGGRPLAPSLSGVYSLLRGDGALTWGNASALVIGPEPVLLEALSTTGMKSAAPAGLALSAPWPQPARASATIAFSLPAAGRATLRLYDIAGRQVRELAAGEFAAGRHEVRVRSIGLRPGIYLAWLRTDGGAVRRRFVVAP